MCKVDLETIKNLEESIMTIICNGVYNLPRFKQIHLGDELLPYQINLVKKKKFYYKINNINNINEEDIINKFKSFANKYLDKYEFIAFSNDGIIMNNLDKTRDNLNCVFVLKLYMCKEKI